MTTITIHNILLNLSSSSDSEPPDDLNFVAKIIAGNNVIIESKPSAMSTGKLWTFVLKSDLPADCASFDIEISGTSDSQQKDFRLESVHLNTSDIVAKADDKQPFPSDLDVKSIDGVLSLHLRADFSIQMGNNEAGFPYDDRMIASLLSQTADRELEPDVIDNLHRSIQFLPDSHPMRSPFLAGVGDIYIIQFREFQSQDALNKAIDIFQEAMLNALWNDTQIHTYAVKYGNALLDRFEEKGAVDDIKNSVSVFEEVVQLTPYGHPDKPPLLNNLSISLSHRFECLGDLSDMNKSILVQEEAIQLTPDGHPDKPSWLNNLSISLFNRFMHLGDLSDMNKSVLMKEQTVQLSPDDHPNKPLWLNNLGNSLLHRFEHLGDLSDINKSVLVKEEAIQLTPDGHSDKPSRLNDLSKSLLCRFERLGELSDMSRSILVSEEAVQLTPDSHPDKPFRLNNLGNSLLCCFERLGDLSNLNKSILVFQEAVQLTLDGHPKKFLLLNNLGISLLHRFERLGNLSDMNESILVKEKAVQLTSDGHPDKPSLLSNFGISLLSRFEHLKDLSDINKSVSVKEKAVQLTPNGHSDKPSRLSNLGNSLLRRFEHLGNLSDINKSSLIFEEAIQLTPDNHPDKPLYLNNFSSSLLRRFEHLGDLSDLNKSLLVFEKTVQLTPDGHPDKPLRLNNFGISLLRHFERLSDFSDINKSIEVFEKAIQLTPDDHSDKSLYLGNLGNSLLYRFKCLEDLNDINKSVLIIEEALQLTPHGHPNKPSLLNSLASSLLHRFGLLQDVSDINKSVSVIEETVQQTPDSHSNKPIILSNLGIALLCRFECLRDFKDVEMASKMFEKAAKSPIGSSSSRFRACSYWAMYCQLHYYSPILDVYQCAFNLLPNMSWLGLSITDRQHFLKGVGPLVEEAVSAAINAGQFETAIEWMDQGHSVIWSQLLQLRTPIDDLKQCYPEIADRFTLLSKKLEGASTSDKFKITFNDLSHHSVPISSENYHELVNERNQLLQYIRELDGFDQFLLPQTFSQLQRAACNGPVICINVSKSRSNALILMPGLNNILHISLEKFTHKTAEMLYRQLRHLLERNGHNVLNDINSKQRKAFNFNDLNTESVLEHLIACNTDRGMKLDHSSSNPETEFQYILANLWHTVIKPILNGLVFSEKQSEDALVRVWWFTSGFLTFLPIYAAGIYGETAFPGSKLSDFVISSYIPTLSSIITDSCSTTLSNPQVLAVALPVESKLPGTQRELDCIINRVGLSNVKKLVESEATLENVIAGLKESSFVHFACHGKQNATNPNESALLLAKSSQLTISHLHHLSLPYAQFAFLSACQTAVGDETLIQESVHLAAGMLSAGYRGVIATMWSITDSAAPTVADEVYAELFKNSEPDPTQAAYALDKAIKKLIKDSNGKKSFLEWVPFIHIGI